MNDERFHSRETLFTFESETDALNFENYHRPRFEGQLRYCIESGQVEVADKSTEAIIRDALTYWGRRLLQSEAGTPIVIPYVVDHRSQLLSRANAILESESESDYVDGSEVVITMYAIWLEHTINNILIKGCWRLRMPGKIISLLLRKFGWQEKLRDLWEAVGLPKLEQPDLALIQKIMDRRNAFIHYKWNSVTEEDLLRDGLQYADIVETIEQLIERLDLLEDQLFWGGRRENITAGINLVLDAFFDDPQAVFNGIISIFEAASTKNTKASTDLEYGEDFQTSVGE